MLHLVAVAIAAVAFVLVIGENITAVVEQRQVARQRELRSQLRARWMLDAELASILGETEDADTIRLHMGMADHLAWEMVRDRKFRKQVTREILEG